MEITNRNTGDVEKIQKYLETLKEFTNFLQPKSNNNSDLISKVAETLKYEKIPENRVCLLYTSPSPRDRTRSRMPSSA